MLHLLPIRWMLTILIALIGIALLAVVYAGDLAYGDTLHDILSIVRLSSLAAGLLIICSFALWRWIPILQTLTFPYLGGAWSGKLNYTGARANGTRDVTLRVFHNLLRIQLILETSEANSRTLVVHAERDTGLRLDRLYYVYLNERKEGVPGAGDRYRGLAILRVEFQKRSQAALLGSYFTETKQTGTLELTRVAKHPWWKVWA
jgi:hypothetical protein